MNERILSLAEKGRIARAIYLVWRESIIPREISPHHEFVLGLLLCNSRNDVFRLYSAGLHSKEILNAVAPGLSNPSRPLFADPQMLAYAYEHFSHAYLQQADVYRSPETYRLQQVTAELLLEFIRMEQVDPHTRSMRVQASPYRVIQLAYLCLVQLSPDLIPADSDGLAHYQGYVEWARLQSIKDRSDLQ